MSATAVVLPELDWMPSPNWSERSRASPVPDRRRTSRRARTTARPSGRARRRPSERAPPHEGNGTGVDVATQLVAWDKKLGLRLVQQRLLQHRGGRQRGTAPTLARSPSLRDLRLHLEAGPGSRPSGRRIRCTSPGSSVTSTSAWAAAAQDPTGDVGLWNSFIKQVGKELERGGFRKTWGRGPSEKLGA